jgi:hypothetical protein
MDPVCHPTTRIQSRRRMLTLLPLLVLCSSLVLAPAAVANQAQKTICCRTSGGTRGSCLNLWAHLVPPGNRFDPGPRRLIALLQGPSVSPTAMHVQITSLTGERLVDQTLPAQRGAVWLLAMPESNPKVLAQHLVWESFPTCRPDKPPTRSILEPGSAAKATTAPLTSWRASCGKEVTTAALLQAVGLEEWSGKLPTTLPVMCLPLTTRPTESSSNQGSEANP